MKNLEQIKMQIEESQVNETIMVSARSINGGKFSVEFAEKLREDNNVLGILNAADSRFNSGGRARRAWLSVEPTNFEEQFGIDLTTAETVQDDYGRQVVPLGIANPAISTPSGNEIELGIQVTESTSIDAIHNTADSKSWALANPHKSIKQDGTGNALYLDNMPIYSKAEVVAKDAVSHTYVKHNAMQPVQSPVNIVAEEEEAAVDVLAQ
jgi:hypothetical protein